MIIKETPMRAYMVWGERAFMFSLKLIVFTIINSLPDDKF